MRTVYIGVCGCGGTGRRARLRGVWETVWVQVPSAAPDSENPNLYPIGEGFGFLVML